MADTELPYAAPSSATAGDTIAWRQECSATPYSDGWTVTVSLTGPGTVSSTATADPASDSYCVVTFKPSATTALPAGLYRWTARASRGSGGTLERLTSATGSISIAPDPLQMVADEGLSADERELRTVDALIAKIQAGPNASYTIEGVTATRHDLDSLYRRQGVLRQRVAQSRQTGRRSIGRNVPVTIRRG